jgi:predicted metal-dependent HD superfamily phosphohydrolase
MKDFKSLLQEAKEKIQLHFENEISDKYHFHDFRHVLNVVESCEEISRSYDLTEEEKFVLLSAAWFHDAGYSEGPENHEERSAALAQEFLHKNEVDVTLIEKVKSAIMATKMPQTPKNTLDEILCDADLSHLGRKNYWERVGKLRHEMAVARDRIMGDEEWLDFEIGFMTDHDYFTKIASALYGKRKRKNLRRLLKQKERVTREEVDTTGIEKQLKNNRKKKDPLKELSLGRGVETMYRNAYRTHVNLSAIADNKANIMLSVNAIILSIVVSSLVPRLISDSSFLFPTISLLLTCLIAIIFATLSTKPKVTEGIFTREDIMNRKSNLLFFGNFYKMPLEDFHWGMMEMIKDQDFLYTSMTRDLYFLGKVLAKKYRYLSICYTIFMVGLIVSVILFGISLSLPTDYLRSN